MNKTSQHDPMTAQRYYDGALPHGEAVLFESHLADCAECRASLEAWSAMGVTLRGAFGHAVHERAIPRLVQRARERQLQGSRRIAWGLLAAASLLLLSSLSLVGYSRTAQGETPAIMAQWEEYVISSPVVEEDYTDLESRTLVAIHVQRPVARESDHD